MKADVEPPAAASSGRRRKRGGRRGRRGGGSGAATVGGAGEAASSSDEDESPRTSEASPTQPPVSAPGPATPATLPGALLPGLQATQPAFSEEAVRALAMQTLALQQTVAQQNAELNAAYSKIEALTLAMQQTVAQQTAAQQPQPLAQQPSQQLPPQPPPPPADAADVVVGRVWHKSGAAPGTAVAGVSSDKTHSLTVSEDGLRCAASGEQWGSGRCGASAPPGGIYYFEATQLPPADGDAAAGGILRVGLSTDRASLALGTDTEGFGYGGTGVKCSGLLKADREPRPGQPAGSAFAPYGRKFGAGDVVGVELARGDSTIEGDTIRFFVNGEDQGIAFVVPNILGRPPLHPALAVKGCAALLNLGETPLKHKPPDATSFAAAAKPKAYGEW